MTPVPARLFDLVADLPLVVDGVDTERRAQPFAHGERVTSVVRLRGDGAVGSGEDVTYDAEHHPPFVATAPRLPLLGRWTLAEFSRRLDDLDLWPEPPRQSAYRDYRRWAIESAALDLALAQAGVSLDERLATGVRPVRFVVSTGLGSPPTTARLERIRRACPGIGFKLDATPEWDDALVARLADEEMAEVIDLKGAYRGTPVDNPPDRDLYRRIFEGLPEALVEDPAWNEETQPLLREHAARITWDAPIHSAADIEALPVMPLAINIKPSRFGTVERLFDALDLCRRESIRPYGGGQTELDVGRGQIQLLAAMLYAEAPNDVAPSVYNLPELPPLADLPCPPLEPRPAPAGFRWCPEPAGA